MTNFGFNRLYPEGTPITSATQRRCNTCRNWYPARKRLCPECRANGPKFNPGLRVAMLNEATNKARERAMRGK